MLWGFSKTGRLRTFFGYLIKSVYFILNWLSFALLVVGALIFSGLSQFFSFVADSD